jgi:hypothetical protein
MPQVKLPIGSGYGQEVNRVARIIKRAAARLRIKTCGNNYRAYKLL